MIFGLRQSLGIIGQNRSILTRLLPRTMSRSTMPLGSCVEWAYFAPGHTLRWEWEVLSAAGRTALIDIRLRSLGTNGLLTRIAELRAPRAAWLKSLDRSNRNTVPVSPSAQRKRYAVIAPDSIWQLASWRARRPSLSCWRSRLPRTVTKRQS